MNDRYFRLLVCVGILILFASIVKEVAASKKSGSLDLKLAQPDPKVAEKVPLFVISTGFMEDKYVEYKQGEPKNPKYFGGMKCGEALDIVVKHLMDSSEAAKTAPQCWIKTVVKK